MSKDEVVVDFAGVEGGGGGQFTHVPEGDYAFKVSKTTMKKGGDSGKPYIEMFSEITRGDKKGKKLRDTFSLQKQSLWKLRNFLESCGKTVPSKAIKLNITKMVGWEFAGTVSDEEYEGKKKSIISSYFPLSELSKESSTDELEGAGNGEEEPSDDAEELFSQEFEVPKKPESRLQKKIQGALKGAFPRSLFFKIWGGPFQVKGLPDLIGFVDGRFIAIEVKMPNKNLTLYQEEMNSTINFLGAIAIVAHSPEEAIFFIRTRLNSIRSSKV